MNKYFATSRGALRAAPHHAEALGLSSSAGRGCASVATGVSAKPPAGNADVGVVGAVAALQLAP